MTGNLWKALLNCSIFLCDEIKQLFYSNTVWSSLVFLFKSLQIVDISSNHEAARLCSYSSMHWGSGLLHITPQMMVRMGALTEICWHIVVFAKSRERSGYKPMLLLGIRSCSNKISTPLLRAELRLLFANALTASFRTTKSANSLVDGVMQFSEANL